MTRKELYEAIVKENMQDAIKNYFDKNYTNISTANLESFVNDWYSKNQNGKCDCKETSNIDNTKIKLSVIMLVSYLQSKHIINDTEAKEIIDLMD